jgi:glycosyltransferase involved in cell wall biosynthesis
VPKKAEHPASKEPATLSLVVCTRNRAQQLSACLEAVARMTKPTGFELIVVNNASTDDTARFLSDFRRGADFPVVVCDEPTPGLGRARNTGWRASKGDVVAFTDDDCYVASDYAEQVLRLFQARDIAYFGGRILLHDPRDYPITIQLSEEELQFGPRQFVHAGQIQGANFGFTRVALIECGGFDDNLGAGTEFCCEDVEIVGRLSAAGKAGLYSPLPVVAHHHGRRAGPVVEELNRQYAIGRGAYYIAMIMTPGMRLSTTIEWARLMRHQPGAETRREIAAACRFIWQRRLLKGGKCEAQA